MLRLIILIKGIFIFLISLICWTLDPQAKVVLLQLYMARLDFSTETVKLIDSTWLSRVSLCKRVRLDTSIVSCSDWKYEVLMSAVILAIIVACIALENAALVKR